MNDLVTWLRQQLDDDERTARAADSSRWLPEDKGITFEYTADDFHGGEAQARLVADTRANQEHIARWDPARVLAEVDAKRRIIDTLRGFEPNDQWATQPDMGLRENNAAGALRAIALPYADRPGYRQEWKP